MIEEAKGDNFNSDSEKHWLESLLHQAIAKQVQYELSSSESPYTILVSPLLLETNQKDFCSKVLVVDVPVETQVSRTWLEMAYLKNRLIQSLIHK